jgi:diguanylate cyclase (GGDEF)-like protein/PAS domain S-box-containing protein
MRPKTMRTADDKWHGEDAREHEIADLLLASTQDLVWMLYFDGRPGWANRRLCGYSVEELTQADTETLIKLHAANSHQRLKQAIDYVRSSAERVIGLELEVEPKVPGVARQFRATLAPLSDDVGRIVGIQGIYRDVTDWIAIERAWREGEARFLDIVESAHDLVWTVDREGRWTYLNQAAKYIYGCAPEQMVGRSIQEVTHPDHWPNDSHILQQVFAGKEFTLHETAHVRADGDERLLSFNIKPRLDKYWSVIGAMGTARDITEQKNYQRQLEHLAQHDALTGLFNRHYFQQALNRAAERVGRGPLYDGLLYIDLDNFKYINDILGHMAGDKLLVEVSALLQERLRRGDLLARFGGDEFTLLLQAVDADKIRVAADAYRDILASYTFSYQEKAFNLTASIGATLFNDPSDSAEDFLGQADLACTLAKAHGRNQIHIYDPTDEAKAVMVADVGWVRRIREALERDRFTLFYQPIVRVDDGSVFHYEALLRLRDGEDTIIAPGAFLPAAERFSLINQIDRWVVEHAIVKLVELARANHRASIAINLSGRAYEDAELLLHIGRLLEQYPVDPACLTFEITESEAISHFLDAKLFVAELKALGCRFALDDFGSGFSSYSYLKALPVDFLKIDGSFVQGLANDPVDQALVKSMNEVAHALGKQTIAEFVEDEASFLLLKAYGVDFAQGYYLGRPSSEIGIGEGHPTRD